MHLAKECTAIDMQTHTQLQFRCTLTLPCCDVLKFLPYWLSRQLSEWLSLLLLQLAQRDDPVEETRLEDQNVHHGAENSPDSDKFDKGHIAPEPGMQTQGGADGDKQQDKVDVEYSMMQPVYSLEYTESIKPKHIPAEKVLHL